MNVAIALENRFRRGPAGTVWSRTGSARTYWSRYLEVFDNVIVVARVEEGDVGDEWQRVDGDRVSVVAMPPYRGPLQYLRARRQIADVARSVVGATEAVILRVPSPIAAALVPHLRAEGRPYGAEVVGDPFDVYAPGAVRHPLRPFFRWWFTRQLRDQIVGASAVAYITQDALQRRYPAARRAFATSYPGIHTSMPPSFRTASARTFPDGLGQAREPVKLVTVGSLAQMYKGVDVLLDAMATCIRRGIPLELTVIGDGRHRTDLEQQARMLGLADRVRFVGEVSPSDLVPHLDAADVFILPSRSEGLPQAIIEAMARALPCVASTVGGIPELLEQEDLVRPGDSRVLADKIAVVVTDSARMTRMSARNWEAATEYDDDALRPRRVAFYRELHFRTADWLAVRSSDTNRPA